MRSPRVWAIVLGVLGVLAIGFLIAPAPLLPVILAAEPIFYLPLPTGGYFTITNTIIASWVTIVFWIAFGFWIRGKQELVPTGSQNFIEAVVEWAITQIEQFGGKENVAKFFPLVMTIFLMIVTSNWFGLLPGFGTIGRVHIPKAAAVVEEAGAQAEGEAIVQTTPPTVTLVQGPFFAFISLFGRQTHGPEKPVAVGEKFDAEFLPVFRSANTDLNMTLGLAIIAFLMIEYWGIRAGGARYFSKFVNINFKQGAFLGVVNIFLGFVETLSELARLISFAFRLFGNVFAGEVLLAVMVFLVPWLLVVPFYALELFVGFIQAGVFAILVMAFGREAMAHGAHASHSDSEHAHAH